ncbi:MAG TPA: FlgD immunoglobulin-like domain containing protein, partial [Bacteroidota bacterium]|nr:FlgD immunoglobulin-like domain containing protein [Bacteroidota bacterium]
LAMDIDADGRDEVYLPTWYGSNGASVNAGVLHMVSYPTGSSTSEIDSATNATRIDLTSAIGLPTVTPSIYNANMLGIGFGDIDGNGKKNIYVSGIDFGTTGFNVASVEFQGGDKRNPANWTSSLLYRNEPSILASMTIKDSLGKRDTTKTIWAAQVAKMVAAQTDLDGDGLEDILMPYQYWYANPDSVTVTKYTWSGTAYDSTTYKFANAKRWTFRVLERSSSTGVEAKDLTVVTPEDYVLEQNYPNPFNPSTSIRFGLPVKNTISLVIYDMIGREVKTLIAGQEMAKGAYQVEWDGTNNAGTGVASGSYVYTLKFGNFSTSQKMVLVR